MLESVFCDMAPRNKQKRKGEGGGGRLVGRHDASSEFAEGFRIDNKHGPYSKRNVAM